VARKFTVSPTKLRLFRTCAAKYRWEYIEKLGRFYRKPRAGFSFGASLHNVLEKFHAEGGAESVTVEALTERLSASWQSQGYQSLDQEAAYKFEAVKILEAYHARATEVIVATSEETESKPATVLYSEKTLSMPLSPEITLTGRVDRVDEHADGALEIVDYKSGRSSVTTEDVSGALAMRVYQTLLTHLHPDRRVYATIYALRTGASASHEQTTEEREWLTADCLETAEIIKHRDWEAVLPTPIDACEDCDYLPHCTRWWKRHADFIDA
jgi:putative RecB family exonuclease